MLLLNGQTEPESNKQIDASKCEDRYNLSGHQNCSARILKDPKTTKWCRPLPTCKRAALECRPGVHKPTFTAPLTLLLLRSVLIKCSIAASEQWPGCLVRHLLDTHDLDLDAISNTTSARSRRYHLTSPARWHPRDSSKVSGKSNRKGVVYSIYYIQSPPPNSLWFHSPKSCIKMAFANVENHLVRHAYLQIIFYLSLHKCFFPTIRVFVLSFYQPLCLYLSFVSPYVDHLYPLSLSFFGHFVCRCLFISCWSCPLKKENYLLDRER